MVRVFNEGQLVSEIIPEIWLFGNERFTIAGPRQEKTVADLRIVSVATEYGKEQMPTPEKKPSTGFRSRYSNATL